MPTASKIACILLLASTLIGCAAKSPVSPAVRIPPRVDLSQHETIGVIEFHSTGDRALADMATQRFTESARRDQGLVRMLDLGAIDRGNLDPEAYRAIAREHGVQTLLVGELTITKQRPSVRIDSSLKGGSVTALVEATLAVRLIEASSGASIWSGSARATDSTGGVSMASGQGVAVAGEDPQRVYAALVDQLVEQATYDFHEHWTR
jgi:hypothetical protein